MSKTDTLYVPPGMSRETISYICESFNKAEGRHINFRVIRKDGLIGGFIAEIDGEIYDAAISSRLAELRKHFSGKV